MWLCIEWYWVCILTFNLEDLLIGSYISVDTVLTELSQISSSICSDVGIELDCCGEQGAEPEGEALSLLLALPSNPHLCLINPG